MSSLSFVQRTFDWDEGNDFVWRGRCKDWGATCSPSKCVKKTLISRQTLGYFSTLDLTQIFSKHLINLLAPQPGVFLG